MIITQKTPKLNIFMKFIYNIRNQTRYLHYPNHSININTLIEFIDSIDPSNTIQHAKVKLETLISQKLKSIEKTRLHGGEIPHLKHSNSRSTSSMVSSTPQSELSHYRFRIWREMCPLLIFQLNIKIKIKIEKKALFFMGQIISPEPISPNPGNPVHIRLVKTTTFKKNGADESHNREECQTK